ncbi:50S ribosomal subunit protein L2 [Wigglesworthia glossinidia endosymbiont of Glossina morsitans morsitans (Yale colony)]|uniref:Large ribosomal subunit protein uL2 n=1 Tax=Wigglesworthia glossinidia endosymbiont of Glossina morsitans morsitans (Yale colony) TaxID=1142511 RepID=H6Q4J0_WIGGL|nr:50S ribosomal protein L2 [Wigglesworthia glossinidia]AFA41050.1 50S ribosomal subunit protein L2 [Wigglesworthia glossinidia endosymbiont of Glossina morsitans morsitans (Yale colony)]
MTLNKCKPTTPSRRHTVKIVNSNLYKGKSISKLTKKLNKSGGRNNQGHITTRHIGGGHKKKYRIIDFKRTKDNIVGKVARLEYDPNRSSHIALVVYQDGEKKYILAAKDLHIGDKVQSGINAPIKIGNALPMKLFPAGSIVHNVELKLGKGGQIARSAGSYVQIITHEKNYVIIRLRSGETRKVFNKCRATFGEVGNDKHMLISLGKAGAKRWRGIRPTVRGTAMNPVDHPHGGGEGRNFGKHPVSPWGVQTKGKKTRRNKRTEQYILHHRKSKKQ